MIARPLDRNDGLVPDSPCVVSGRQLEDIVRAALAGGAIAHEHAESAGQDHAHVPSFAPVSSDKPLVVS